MRDDRQNGNRNDLGEPERAWDACGATMGFCPRCAFECRPWAYHPSWGLDCAAAQERWEGEQKNLRDEIGKEWGLRARSLTAARKRIQKRAGGETGREPIHVPGCHQVYMINLPGAIPFGEDRQQADFTHCVYCGVSSNPAGRMRDLLKKWLVQCRIDADAPPPTLWVLAWGLRKQPTGHALERQMLRALDGGGPPMMNNLRSMSWWDRDDPANARRHHAEITADEEIVRAVPINQRRPYEAVMNKLSQAVVSGVRISFRRPKTLF